MKMHLTNNGFKSGDNKPYIYFEKIFLYDYIFQVYDNSLIVEHTTMVTQSGYNCYFTLNNILTSTVETTKLLLDDKIVVKFSFSKE